MVQTIFLVRHGEAESNRGEFFGGWINDPLTPLGRSQASALKKRLSREGIGRVFCSDLLRARQTAEAVSLGCPTEFSESLREKSYGELEGIRWGDEYESKYERYHSDAYARAKDGENSVQVQRRVVAYFKKKVLNAREKKVLIVSHHGPIVLLVCDMLGIPVKNWRRMRLGNCGLCILEKEGKLWRLKLWNSLSYAGLASYAPLLSKDKR